MQAAVIAHEMEGQPTGVGRYLGGLLSGVVRLDPGWRWRLYLHGEPFDHPLWAAPGFEPVFACRRGRAWLWEQRTLPEVLRRSRHDVVFSPSYSLPPRAGAPGVVTVHDLSFELRGGELGARERWRRRLLARRACRDAVRVLADTEAVRRQLLDRYRLPATGVGVVPLAVDAAFREAGEVFTGRAPRDDAAPPAIRGVHRPYLLFLGTLLERRNLPLMLALLARLRREWPELSLVLAGANRLRRPRELAARVREAGLEEAVTALGYVSDEEVLALYRGASMSLYLSAYEGYGLPPLESLACGTPALVGPGLALDDLWPRYPFRCPSLRLDEVAQVAGDALADPLTRRRVAEEGVERIGRLTWRRSAEVFLGELERARQ